MPKANLNYSSDLELDARAILVSIEETIQAYDADAGACKGRAFRADVFHHSHVYIEIEMLERAHRDAVYFGGLLPKLEAAIKAHLHQSCAFSMKLSFLPKTYVTNMHLG